MPNTLTDDPRRAQLLQDTDDPRCTKFKIDTDEPRRAKLRTAKDAANRIESIKERENTEPNRDITRTDKLVPTHRALLSDTDDPLTQFIIRKMF